MGSFRKFWGMLLAGLLASPLAFPAGDPQNPGIIEISDPTKFSKVVAISDAHGDFGPVKNLLRAYGLIDQYDHWSGGKTLFVVIGDSINKGKKSVKLLDFWIRLQEEAQNAGGQLVHTLGNHEAKLLAHGDEFIKKNPKLAKDLKKNGITAEELLDRSGSRGKFLHSMPAGVRVGNVLFVHSGQVPDMDWKEFVSVAQTELRQGNYAGEFLLGDDSILEARSWIKDEGGVKEMADRMKKMGLTSIVFGHDAKALGAKHKQQISAAEIHAGGPDTETRTLIKIDIKADPANKVSQEQLLFFNNTQEMMQEVPPRGISFTSRRMKKTRFLQPCEVLYGEFSR